MNMKVEFIIYVSDQESSTRFYTELLQLEPSLHVPGMTEFTLSPMCKFGIMPNHGMAKILQDKTPHPSKGTGIPRCELYLFYAPLETHVQRALTIGATIIQPIEEKDWGDRVCYLSDLDGHIIALAEKI